MRKPRELVDNHAYHVYGRVNRRQMEFNPDMVKDLFLEVIKQGHKKYDFILYTYVIMPNHYHIVIKPLNGESLSKIMQWILSVFAMRYNRLMQIDGHFWGDRFHSKLIQSYKYFLNLIFYLAGNPVRAGLVKKFDQWAYSGYTVIVNKQKNLYAVFGKIEKVVEFMRRIIEKFAKNYAK